MRKFYSLIVPLGGVAAYNLAVSLLLIPEVMTSSAVALAFLTLVMSPVLPVFTTIAKEGRSLKKAIDLKTQSWAFLLGDVGLAIGLMFGTIAWQALPAGGFWTSWVWLVACLLFGLTAGVVFHVWDRNNYRKAGAIAHADAPSKIVHDLLVYPYLVGILHFVWVPLLFNGMPHWGAWVLTSMVAVWAILMIRDNVVGMNPHELHPPYTWQSEL